MLYIYAKDIDWNEKIGTISLAQLYSVAHTSEWNSVSSIPTDLKNKDLVFTGTLATMTRQEAEKKVEKAGGRCRGTVSRNTDLLVCGAAAGSKANRAKTLGVKIICESEFLRLLDGKFNVDLTTLKFNAVAMFVRGESNKIVRYIVNSKTSKEIILIPNHSDSVDAPGALNTEIHVIL